MPELEIWRLPNQLHISEKKPLFAKTWSRVVHKIPKVKMSRKFRSEGLPNSLMLAKRPLFAAVRSLINSPSWGAFSSSELTSQENPFPKVFSLSDPSTENMTAQNASEEILLQVTLLCWRKLPLTSLPVRMFPLLSLLCLQTALCQLINWLMKSTGMPQHGHWRALQAHSLYIPSELISRWSIWSLAKPEAMVLHPQQWHEKAHFSCYPSFENGVLWHPHAAGLGQAHLPNRPPDEASQRAANSDGVQGRLGYRPVGNRGLRQWETKSWVNKRSRSQVRSQKFQGTATPADSLGQYQWWQ